MKVNRKVLFFLQVFSADASRKVGLITKQWSGLLREAFTNADIFGVSFPGSLDIKLKALLLAAAILIVRFFMIIELGLHNLVWGYL